MILALSLIFAATLVKLAASVDDLVWLARLAAAWHGRRRLTLALAYLGTTLAIGVMAWPLARLGETLATRLAGAEHAFTLVGGVALVVYAATVLRGEEDDDDPELGLGLGPVVIVTALGSIDELLLYTLALSTKQLSLLTLLLGNLLGGGIVLALVFGALTHASLERTLARVPFWLVVAALGLTAVVFALLGLGR